MESMHIADGAWRRSGDPVPQQMERGSLSACRKRWYSCPDARAGQPVGAGCLRESVHKQAVYWALYVCDMGELCSPLSWPQCAQHVDVPL